MSSFSYLTNSFSSEWSKIFSLLWYHSKNKACAYTVCVCVCADTQWANSSVKGDDRVLWMCDHPGYAVSHYCLPMIAFLGVVWFALLQLIEQITNNVVESYTLHNWNPLTLNLMHRSRCLAAAWLSLKSLWHCLLFDLCLVILVGEWTHCQYLRHPPSHWYCINTSTVICPEFEQRPAGVCSCDIPTLVTITLSIWICLTGQYVDTFDAGLSTSLSMYQRQKQGKQEDKQSNLIRSGGWFFESRHIAKKQWKSCSKTYTVQVGDGWICTLCATFFYIHLRFILYIYIFIFTLLT